MAFWNRKKNETRGVTNEADLLQSLLNTSAVSRSQALEIPSVAFCVNLIANTIGMTSIKLYEMVDGVVKPVDNDPRVALLNENTGDILTGYQLKRAMIRDYLLDGAGYAYINRERNNVKSIHYVKRNQVSPLVGTDPIFKTVEVLVNGARYEPHEFLKILRNTEDGITGTGVVQENNLLLSVAYNALKYENVMNLTGGNKKGFLKSSKRLEKQAFDELKAAYKLLYAGNSENMLVLNDGVTFEAMSATAVEQQMSEMKSANSIEICKVFNTPPALLQISNVPASVYIEFIKQACLTIMSAFETGCNDDLLLPSEKKTKYFAFDTKELLRASIKERYEAYKIGLDSGFLMADEVRNTEDMAPIGVPYVRISGLNSVFYNPKTGEIYTPNTNKVADLTKKGGDENDSGNQE